MPEIRHLAQAPTGRRPLAPGGGIDAHVHDTHQIVYACRGVLSVTTGAGTWVAPANRAIWVPAGTVHEHRAHGDTDLRLVGLTGNPLALDRPTVLAVDPLLRELIIAYTGEPGHEDARDGEHDGRHGAEHDGEHDGVRDGEHDGVRDGEHDGEHDRLLRVLLDRLRRAPERPLHLPAPADPRLAAVCAALHRDPADTRTLAALAAAAGTSERTLARLFRRELGMSFPQWRTQLRLHRALLLLADGVPVTAVAHRCGWASASAFIDVFRRALGYTPGRAFTL
ncbi:helix-turn-helix domain-containing protein [Actinomadura sp. ATCC 31491]|uniref:Helix-turn-helix domain-containing protein n=1 Tax=Actinomadura luzonensis TaxID=2805427 RepID=A0ABT0G9W6_9ACTN|nr:helix-turn-helix transcriptional regulator [Actinomadura luzonensis]MCK2220876.1 helix-turn-helix domain-containing protein [Actinomadura luzonensis]